MAKMVSVATYQDLIDEAGIPNEGVCEDGRISFLPTATAEQKSQADAILTELRARPKPKRSDKKATRQAVRALSNADTAKLVVELLTERELSEPGWAARRGVEIWPTP